MKIQVDRKRIIFYLWVGLAFLVIWMISDWHSNPESYRERWLNNLWRVLYVTVVNIILFEFTIPGFRKRKIGYSILAVLAHIFFYSYGLYVWREIGVTLGSYIPLVDYPSVAHNVQTQMSYSVTSIFFYGIVKHIYDHIKLKQFAQKLRLEKQEAELNYLKSQTNPHFLFNTLNNIYALSRDKSNMAPEAILRLSKILRFMLYETGGAFIAIEQEIKIISDYIALEKLRYDESLRVEFSYDIEDLKQSIPPLLLIPLVENAFKHGVSETRHQPFVDVFLSVKRQQLQFVVKNSTELFTGDTAPRENIGLSNLRRQLELLYKTYDLQVKQEGSVFTAVLNINLASHV